MHERSGNGKQVVGGITPQPSRGDVGARMVEPPVRSEAWLLMGLTGSVGGILQLLEGRLSFTATPSAVAGTPPFLGRQLRSLEQKAQRPGLAEALSFRAAVGGDEAVRVFDVPLEEVGEVTLPWYYFGYGTIFAVRDARFRFSFIKPQNAKAPGSPEYIGGAIGDLYQGRGAGRAWKAALGPR